MLLVARSQVVVKFLNYVTDKIVRVVLTTSALMLRCVQTICVGEGDFGYFSVVRPLKQQKSFGEVIRNCNAVKRAASNYIRHAFP